MDENTDQNQEATNPEQPKDIEGDELKKLEAELKKIENPVQEPPAATAPTVVQTPPVPGPLPVEGPQVPSDRRESRDSKILMAAIGLLILSLVGVGAYFLGTNKRALQPTPTPYFLPTAIPVATEVPVSTPEALPTATASASPSGSPTGSPTAKPSASPTY